MKKRHALSLAVASFLLGFASLYLLGFMSGPLWLASVLLLGFGFLAVVRLFTASGRYLLGFVASYTLGFMSFAVARLLYIASGRELFAFLF